MSSYKPLIGYVSFTIFVLPPEQCIRYNDSKQKCFSKSVKKCCIKKVNINS